jgi:hypothetical protein
MRSALALVDAACLKGLERPPDVTGHVPPDWTIANVAQIGDCVVDGAVRNGLRIGPVDRVERLFRGFARLARSALHRRRLRQP